MGADGKFTSSWVRYSSGSTSCRRQVLVRLANIDAVFVSFSSRFL